jgi:hypothetical protein
MRTIILVIVILSSPFFLKGQRTIKSAPFYPNDHKTYNEKNVEVMHNNISINPLNIFLFQQIGVTYEYRLGKLGFGITPGYILQTRKNIAIGLLVDLLNTVLWVGIQVGLLCRK